MDHPSLNPINPDDDGRFTFPCTLFPDELLLEILIRLTPKSICQLKCLSKHWLSFLTSHRFLSGYTYLSPQPSSWILVDRDGRFSPGPGPSPNLSFPPSQPPNITYLTLSGLPSRLTKPGPPTVLASSNGLILFSLTPSNHLYICNPVTRDWAPLPVPDCGEITSLYGVALSAKYTPTCDDVSLVVIDLQTSRKGATLLTYRSITGQWEARPANFRAGNPADVQFPGFSVDGSLEVNGKIFWFDVINGLMVLDDLFGDRAELRFIPHPPKLRNRPQIPRLVYLVGGFVQCFVEKEREWSIWRLNDVEEGAWGVLYKTDNFKWRVLFHGGFRLWALHPLDIDLAIMAKEDEVVLVNIRKGEVVEMVSLPKINEKQLFYLPVVLPTLPFPLPLRLRATSAKENGNIYFKNKNFKEAIVYYSRSISCLPTAAAYANRAAANFELGKYQEAEMDCSEALKIDEHYVKVYVRRAIVRKELGMFFKAKEDCEMALKLDGQHHEVLKLYAEINCILEKQFRRETNHRGFPLDCV